MNKQSKKIMVMVIVVFLLTLSFPVTAAQFSAKGGEYQGWGIILKIDPGFSTGTYHWKTYPKYPVSKNYSFYPGDLIAEQHADSTHGINGEIIYSSLSAGKVHITVNRSWYRNSYQYDLAVLGVGEQAIIGSVKSDNNADGSVIIIKLIHVEENGKATFRIAQTQFK